jgi:hypothetical protein
MRLSLDGCVGRRSDDGSASGVLEKNSAAVFEKALADESGQSKKLKCIQADNIPSRIIEIVKIKVDAENIGNIIFATVLMPNTRPGSCE